MILTVRVVISCCVMLLIMGLLGCGTTQTMVAYDGSRLQQDRAATLNIRQHLFGSNIIYVKAIDNRNDPKWVDNPDNIELMPGKHSLRLEAFYPAYRKVVGFNFEEVRPQYIGEITVVFDAEAGHKYDLKMNNRASGEGFLRCTIEDRTAGGMVVYPPKREPKRLSLTEIPKDKAVVVFYRERRAFILLASDVGAFISEKNQDIDILYEGSLVYHVTTPGSHTYAIGYSGRGKTTNVNLMPGVVTYLQFGISGPTLTLVTEAEALEEIRRGIDIVK